MRRLLSGGPYECRVGAQPTFVGRTLAGHSHPVARRDEEFEMGMPLQEGLPPHPASTTFDA